MNLISSTQKKQIEKELNKFGLAKLPYLLIQTGKNRIRGYSGNLSREELGKLIRSVNVEIIGLYLFRQDKELRISFDGTQILKPTKQIINIDDKQAELWLKGQPIQLSTSLKGHVVIKNNQDFLGSGKVSENKIHNFVPKERRLKN